MVQDRWNDADANAAVAAAGPDPADQALALRVYTSRLIGADPDLVMHGGGNTSVKVRRRDLFGREIEVLHVKGSGWDLETIEARGLPGVRLAELRELRALEALSDEDMVNVQRCNLLDCTAPTPSVETLLHAYLPHAVVDHTHATAMLMLANLPDVAAVCREIFGDRVALVPYIMPGFALAKAAAAVFERNPDVEGLLLVNHGHFTFGGDARQSYRRVIDQVNLVEKWFARRAVARWPRSPPEGGGDRGSAGTARRHRGRRHERSATPPCRCSICAPARTCSRFSSAPILRTSHAADPPRRTTSFEPRVFRCCCRHRWRLSRRRRCAISRPSIGPISRASGAACSAAEDDAGADAGAGVDTRPRPGWHRRRRGGRAHRRGPWRADPARHARRDRGRWLPVDRRGRHIRRRCWSLEQAKLGKGAAPPFRGRIVLVTGAAGAIGRAVVQAFRADGAVGVPGRSRRGCAGAQRRTQLGRDAGGIVLDLAAETAGREAVEACVSAVLAGSISSSAMPAPPGPAKWRRCPNPRCAPVSN